MQTAEAIRQHRPRPWRYSVGTYNRMADMGFFDGRRVELIEGKIIVMAAQYEPHVAGVTLAAQAVERAFGPGYWARRQSPLLLGKRSMPEPDIAVVTGSVNDYVTAGTPTGALLVIEVSDSTLKFDQSKKASMYARHGIADYWIINIVAQQLEVHREPVADPMHRFKHRYASIAVLRPEQSIAPLAAGHSSIVIADMMPKPPFARPNDLVR